MQATIAERAWPDGFDQVPYWVYSEADILAREQKMIFEGPTWNYLCLEADLPEPGRFRTTFVGAMPVVVVRSRDGELYGFENRCSHRGALIVLEDEGKVEDFQCVYHAWRYDLEGTLRGIAFGDGVSGRGGMPPGFCMEERSPRKLRVETHHGLVFGSLSDDVAPMDEYLGPEVSAKLARVLHKPVEVLGRFTQSLPNNWKLYAENTRDTYHASLLHTFFTTFKITRLDQAGGVTVSADGGHHASSSYAARGNENSYRAQEIRSENDAFSLRDPSFLTSVDEFNDGIQVQILSIFPTFILQQIHNSLAVRQIVPRGPGRMDLNWTYFGFTDDTPELRAMRLKQSNLIGPAGYVSMEDGAVGGFVQRGVAAAGEDSAVIRMGGSEADSQETRATESSVRGFWKRYRQLMAL